MRIKKIAAALMAAVCLGSAAACSKNGAPKTAEDFDLKSGEVSELITPAEGSEEANLGDYRFSEYGTKLYYDEDVYATDIILTMDKYFHSFAENDFELYKSIIYPDYEERYSEYLNKEYNYSMDSSFKLRRDSLTENMKGQVLYAAEEDKGFTGDFKVTRIKIEPVELSNEMTEDELFGSFFDSYNEIFGMDYFSFVKEDTDALRIFCFYVFAEGEDGKEYSLVGGDVHNQGPKIILAEKDGNYYTFG